jgi:hypothetical protein
MYDFDTKHSLIYFNSFRIWVSGQTLQVAGGGKRVPLIPEYITGNPAVARYDQPVHSQRFPEKGLVAIYLATISPFCFFQISTR